MTTFQKLDTYLSQEFSDDYWYDDAEFYACDLVKQLTRLDWNTLQTSWKNRSIAWQVRCAEILDWGDINQAIPLLLDMIASENDELTLAAADSLRSLNLVELAFPVSVDEKVLARLQAVKETGNIAKRIVNELLKKLQEQEYRRFLIQVLSSPQEVDSILQANIDKLDDNFAQVLRSWATSTLSNVELLQASEIVVNICSLSLRIQEFPLGNKASNLEIAIAGYETALIVLTRERFEEGWASLQNNLANAYINRLRGDKADNMEKALKACQQALQVYTQQRFPEEWATTQNTLGEAYRNRIKGDRGENVERAINAYQKALQVCTPERLPDRWADTQNNLGIAYVERVQGDKTENRERAITAYKKALKVRTRQKYPNKWAATQNNLAIAYFYRIKGNKTQNLERAITAYKNALQVYTAKNYPQMWALTKNNLGNAYANRIKGDKIQNLEQAIFCFLAALEIRTRDYFPQDYAETIFNLGLAYRNMGQLSNAYNAFAAAIDTVEVLQSQVVSGDEVKQKLTEEWKIIYQCMVEVCLELHDYAKAIEYVERSQARNLVEFLTNPELYPENNVPSEIHNELERLRQEITLTPQQIGIDMEIERKRQGILKIAA
jgi:tetratricopeptide (TPR) repeat protein